MSDFIYEGIVVYIIPKKIYLRKQNAMIMNTKVKEALEKFPEEFSIDDVMDKLIVIDKVERARKQSRNGEVISEDELNDEIEKWFG